MGIYSLVRLLAGENVVDATAANAATAIKRVRSSMTVWTRRAGDCCGEVGSTSGQSNNALIAVGWGRIWNRWSTGRLRTVMMPF